VTLARLIPMFRLLVGAKLLRATPAVAGLSELLGTIKNVSNVQHQSDVDEFRQQKNA
jgi:hypothetical protein